MLTRRAFLGRGATATLTLADLLRCHAVADPAMGKAKGVILLWLWGGPSHLDTFDMKPRAPLEYRGPFEPIATPVPGLDVCELLPGLARRARKFAVLRSLHHESNDHGVAGTIALTGNIAGAVGLDGQAKGNALLPSTGAIVSRLQEPRPGSLPPYVILGDPLRQGHKRVLGEGGGTLGSHCDPFRLDYDPGHGIRIPDVLLPERVSAARHERRWRWLDAVDRPPFGVGERTQPRILGRHYDLAQALFSSTGSLAALDLAREPDRIREAYGSHRFGQCCLIARRLVEAGLPFVQVNWSTNVEGPEDDGDGGWDMHDRYFEIMQDRHGWMFDRALSALLDDLEGRGLLDSTLVVAVGEFGRTPKINDRAGRDHWNPCYSALLAGGGIQGGRVVGASDRRGEYPVDRPFTPADLNATLLHRLGVGAEQLTAIGLNPLGQVIEDLF